MSRRAFFTWVGVIAALGFAGRLIWIFTATPSHSGFGDDFYYHAGAILLAQGKGYIDPFSAAFFHRTAPGADHPPLYLTILAFPSWLGATSFRAHQVTTALLGSGTIVVGALLGRRLAGPRAGVIAAGVIAAYPGFWLRDGRVLSESLAVLLTAVVLLASYRFIDTPSPWRAALLGAAVGLAGLTRSELVFLSVLLIAPLVLLTPVSWLRRAVLLSAAAAAVIVLIGPWVGYNRTRFTYPESMSTQLGATMAYGNCDSTFYGSNIGGWDFDCATTIPGDASVNDRNEQRIAKHYIRTHLSRLPVVVAARLGRTWWVYAPRQTLHSNVDPWERTAGWAWFGSYYLLLVLAVPGAVVLWRRKVSLLPMVAMGVMVCLAVAMLFGTAKYRSPAELVIAVLAAVAVDAAWRRARAGRSAIAA